MRRDLRLVKKDSICLAGGVCAGVAYCVGVSVTQMRILFLVLILVSPSVTVAYILLWRFLPAWNVLPKDFTEVTGERIGWW